MHSLTIKSCKNMKIIFWKSLCRCLCKTGYKQHLTNPLKCVDFDECTEMTAHCPANSSCKNMNGSYKCQCHQGFSEIATGDHRESIQCNPNRPTGASDDDHNTGSHKKKKNRKKKVRRCQILPRFS